MEVAKKILTLHKVSQLKIFLKEKRKKKFVNFLTLITFKSRTKSEI